MADFERLGVCPEIIQAIEEDGWLLPTPVQDEAIPLILGGGDVCVAAETGSGKTGAFGIPCLQIVCETLQNKACTMVSSTSAPQSPSSNRGRMIRQTVDWRCCGKHVDAGYTRDCRHNYVYDHIRDCRYNQVLLLH